ncbi:MAG: addiction module protein [Ignavibacteriales bacterium]|nr:addiction module protein [Ignavibacteriales bacterium]
MSSKEIIRNVLKLSPKEKLLIVDSILKSLDEPDKDIEKVWLDESKKRLKFFRVGKLNGVPHKIKYRQVAEKNFQL